MLSSLFFSFLWFSFALGALNPASPPACKHEYGIAVFQTKVAYSVAQVTSVIGTFQKELWQGLPIISTTGAPNAIGSTRRLNLSGDPFTEELSYSRINHHYFHQKWFLAKGPVTFSALGNLKVDWFYENLTVSPICGGRKASKVHWVVNVCSSNKTVAVTALNQLHASAFTTVVKKLGGRKYRSCNKCYY